MFSPRSNNRSLFCYKGTAGATGLFLTCCVYWDTEKNTNVKVFTWLWNFFSAFSFCGCSTAKMGLCWLKLHESSSICRCETSRDALPFISCSAVDEKQFEVCLCDGAELCWWSLLSASNHTKSGFCWGVGVLICTPKMEQKKNIGRSDCEMYFSDFFSSLFHSAAFSLSLSLSNHCLTPHDRLPPTSSLHLKPVTHSVVMSSYWRGGIFMNIQPLNFLLYENTLM